MIGESDVFRRIKTGRLIKKIGPFAVRIKSDIKSVGLGVSSLYSDYPELEENVFADFKVSVFSPVGVRSYIFKQVLFACDESVPFLPLPYPQAFPLFEWGLNWCISNFSHQYLIIHAAVIEKQGLALILPGVPGSGKSTLCASLINSGWRLLSDELTLIDCQTGQIVPVPRPVSLKNQSISIISSKYPKNYFSPLVHDTLKGTVCLMKPPAEAVSRCSETATPRLVVFPKYASGSDLVVTPLSKGETFMKLADSSFNYSVLGSEGFEVLANMMEISDGYDFVYGGDFDAASICFDNLLNKSTNA